LPKSGDGFDTNKTIAAFEEAQSLTGGFVVLDALEHALALGGIDAASITEVTSALGLGSRMSRLGLVLNLNCHTPPSWAEELGGGPLFSSCEKAIDPEALAASLERLIASLLSMPAMASSLRINFHVSDEDLDSKSLGRLQRFVHPLQRAFPMTFVLDRPKQPIQLAEGIDRRSPAALIAIGIHLPKLVEQLGSNPNGERFLDKSGTLARLALNAAAQKRDFLKRQSIKMSTVHRGFLIDRSRTVIVPLGLEAATRTVTGQGIGDSNAALEFAKGILRRLQDVL